MKPVVKLSIFFTVFILLAACENKPGVLNKSDKEITAAAGEKDNKDSLSGKMNVKDVCYNPNLVKDTSKRSIKSIAVGMINGDSVKINYHSPGVRKRVIWGGLVPYDEVWVTGAHDATTIEFDKTLVIGGKEIPAGKYGLFTIPGENEWTAIINKHWQQHLATEYDQKDDVVRLKVKPMKNQHTERLQYFIEDTGNGNGSIAVAWEKLKISFVVLGRP